MVRLLSAVAACLLLATASAQGTPPSEAPPTQQAPADPPAETLPGPPKVEPSLPRVPVIREGGVRGAWLRPTSDAEKAVAVMDDLAARGYTDVFLEAFFHGLTIWPSAIAPQRPEFVGRDGLAEYVGLAEERGLRLHAWMEVLYWAPPAKYRPPAGLLEAHPDWETLDGTGRPSRQVAEGMGFADPGVFEVRKLLYELSTEVAALYPAVGLHLDYLRYPAGGDFGYNPRTVDNYLALHGRRPSRLDRAWFGYRRDLLTDVANGMSRAYRAAGGKGNVTAAVNAQFPIWHLETVQDWTRWTGAGRDAFDRGVDTFIPMAYSVNLTYLRLLGKFVRARSPRPVWMGVRIGPGFPSLEAMTRVLASEGYTNYVVFDAAP